MPPKQGIPARRATNLLQIPVSNPDALRGPGSRVGRPDEASLRCRQGDCGSGRGCNDVLRRTQPGAVGPTVVMPPPTRVSTGDRRRRAVSPASEQTHRHFQGSKREGGINSPSILRLNPSTWKSAKSSWLPQISFLMGIFTRELNCASRRKHRKICQFGLAVTVSTKGRVRPPRATRRRSSTSRRGQAGELFPSTSRGSPAFIEGG